MGQSIEIHTRYWGVNVTQEMQISYAEILNTLYTAEIDDRIAIGQYATDPNSYMNVPEFNPIIKPGGYAELHRKSYLGPDEICCLQNIRYGWVDANNNISSEANLSKTLLTCDPTTIQVGYSNICDVPLYNTCIVNKNQEYKGKCNVWLNGLFKRWQVDYSIIASINKEMSEHCSKNYKNDNCDIWLSAIRNGTNSEYYNIADNVLYAQTDKSELTCAFPPEYIVRQSNEINTPKECWYRACAFSPNYLLLTENINNKNNCLLSECNININNLNIVSNTELSIICKNQVIYRSSKEQSIIIQEEAEFNRFLIPNYTVYFILILIFIFMFIFSKN